MINGLSLEFWIGVQFVIDLVFVVLVFGLVRRLKRERTQAQQADPGSGVMKSAEEKAGRAAVDIIELLEPLIREAKAAAESFETQILEKKQLIKGLNDTLDARTISINLLLSRAESMLRNQELSARVTAMNSPAGSTREEDGSTDVFDQQNQVIHLYQKGISSDTIATQLGLPKGEVDLIINLKKKFQEMESSV